MSGNNSVVKRAILQAYYPSTQTCDVLLLEATSYFLTGIPIDNAIGASTAIAGALAAVLFFDEHNPNDCVVITVYPNGSQGIPGSGGRITFTAPSLQVNNQTINSGNISTYTLGGNGGIPIGASAALVQVEFHSPSAGAWVDLAAHSSGGLGETMVVGTLYAANATLYGMGIVQLDSNGQIDVQALSGNCVVSIWTYGYVS